MEPPISSIDQILFLLYQLGMPAALIAVLATACIRRPQLPKLLWAGMIIMVASQWIALASLACGHARIDEFLHACIGSKPDLHQGQFPMPGLRGSEWVSVLYHQSYSVCSMLFGIGLLLTAIALWRIARRLISSRLPPIAAHE
jgi:hypothetical protein